MRGRPALFTRYEADSAVLPTNTQRLWFVIGIILVAILPIWLPRDWMILIATAFIASVGVIGLNLITGYAGQVSLGHAFFLGIGAYTGAALGGAATDKVTGLGLDLIIWLPAAGLAAGLVGAIIAPIAVRLKGLYLAFLTLGLDSEPAVGVADAVAEHIHNQQTTRVEVRHRRNHRRFRRNS